MELKLIDRFDDFLRLEQPWNELAQQSPDDHAFMRHEWFAHWLSSQDMTDHLHLITGWRDGQMVATLPLVWRKVRLKGIPFRALRFAESPVSPRCNALAASSDLHPLVERMAAEKGCQLIELEHLAADSPTTELLLGAIHDQSRLLTIVTPGRQSPYLTLNGTWDEYLAALTSRRRSWIRKSCMKRLEECPSPYEIRVIDSEAEADFLVKSMLAISERSWKAAQGTAVGQVASQRRLFELFTRVGLAHGLVEARVLLVERQPVAFDYYLRLGRRYSEIRSDYDKNYSQLRPGENLRIALIRRLGEAGGDSELDFGGTATEYKMQWANHVRSHCRVHAARRFSLGASVILWKKYLHPTSAAEAIAPGQDEL